MRFGLVGVKGLSSDTCERIVLERGARPYSILRDFYLRVGCKLEELDVLVKAGAFDALEGRREALYTLGVLLNSVKAGSHALFAPEPSVPILPPLEDAEVLRLNLTHKGLSEDGRHPMDLYRSRAREVGCTPFSDLRGGRAPVAS